MLSFLNCIIVFITIPPLPAFSYRTTVTDKGRTDIRRIVSRLHSDTRLVSIIEKIGAQRPILIQILSRFGNYTIDRYTKTFFHAAIPTIQPRKEFIEIAEKKTAGLLGPDIAKKLRQELTDNPVLLTGNHHCPDYLSITIQGSILFALSKKKGQVLPVIACADIPLNNADYPRGIVTASGVKVNIYPDREKHRLVSCTPAFSREMLHTAQQNIHTLFDQQKITLQEKTLLLDILETAYASDSVLREISYSDQIVLLNSMLWKRIFAPSFRPHMPDIVFLEMEDIVVRLLQKDFQKSDTFFSTVLFNAAVRSRVLQELDGIYGCWDLKKLALLNSGTHTYEEKQQLKKHVGTVFFWGIDQKGRRYSLQLQEAGGRTELQGRDDSGTLHTFRFSPEHIASYLREKSLLPCLFTSYTSLSFVRGFTCYGGFMQTDYLTAMKRGLICALQKEGYHQWADTMLPIPTENYITSMIYALTTGKDGTLCPAGTLDFIQKGGLTKEDMKHIGQMTVTEGMLFGIQTMYNTLFEEKIDPVWLQKLFTGAATGGKKFLLLGETQTYEKNTA